MKVGIQHCRLDCPTSAVKLAPQAELDPTITDRRHVTAVLISQPWTSASRSRKLSTEQLIWRPVHSRSNILTLVTTNSPRCLLPKFDNRTISFNTHSCSIVNSLRSQLHQSPARFAVLHDGQKEERAPGRGGSASPSLVLLL